MGRRQSSLLEIIIKDSFPSLEVRFHSIHFLWIAVHFISDHFFSSRIWRGNLDLATYLLKVKNNAYLESYLTVSLYLTCVKQMTTQERQNVENLDKYVK